MQNVYEKKKVKESEERATEIQRYALWGLAIGFGLVALIGIIILSGGTAIPGVGALTAAFVASPYLVGVLITLTAGFIGAMGAAFGAIIGGIKAMLTREDSSSLEPLKKNEPLRITSTNVIKTASNVLIPAAPSLEKYSTYQKLQMERLKKSVDRIKIPYVHPKVDLIDLQSNGKLLTEELVTVIKNLNLPQGKTSKEALRKLAPELKDIQFSVTRTKKDYFVNYRGEKQGKELGVGGFGKAKLLQEINDKAQHLDAGNWYVLKVIPAKEDEYGKIAQEVQALKKVQQYKGRLTRANTANSIQYEIIMKLASGPNILDLLKSGRKMPTIKWINLAIDSLHALDAIHGKKILHCDIKSENLIYDVFHRNLTPIDWGMALPVEGDKLEALGIQGGTEGYRAPETNTRLTTYNEKTEVHQLGMTIAEFLSLTVNLNDFPKLVKNPLMFSKHPIQSPEIRVAIFNYIKDRMTAKDPQKRPTIREALEFFQKIRDHHLDLLSKIVTIVYVNIQEYNKATPEERKVIREALKAGDLVCLVDMDKPTNLQKYVQIKRELEENGLSVGDEVIQTNPQHLANNLRDYARALSYHDDCICNAFYIRGENEAIGDQTINDLNRVRVPPIVTSSAKSYTNYANEMKKQIKISSVTEAHFTMVSTSLAEEIAKDDKNAPEIQNALDQLSTLNKSDDGLSYGNLYEALDKLQIQLLEMDSTWSLKATLDNLEKIAPRGI